MDLEVDTDGLREAGRILQDAETTLRLPGCAAVTSAGDCFGPSATGREAGDLLTRRAQQSVEALGLLATSAGLLADAVAAAAALFDRLEASLVGSR